MPSISTTLLLTSIMGAHGKECSSVVRARGKSSSFERRSVTQANVTARDFAVEVTAAAALASMALEAASTRDSSNITVRPASPIDAKQIRDLVQEQFFNKIKDVKSLPKPFNDVFELFKTIKQDSDAPGGLRWMVAEETFSDPGANGAKSGAAVAAKLAGVLRVVIPTLVSSDYPPTFECSFGSLAIARRIDGKDVGGILINATEDYIENVTLNFIQNMDTGSSDHILKFNTMDDAAQKAFYRKNGYAHFADEKDALQKPILYYKELIYDFSSIMMNSADEFVEPPALDLSAETASEVGSVPAAVLIVLVAGSAITFCESCKALAPIEKPLLAV